MREKKLQDVPKVELKIELYHAKLHYVKTNDCVLGSQLILLFHAY